MLSLVLALSLAVRGQPYVKYPEPGIQVRMSRNNRLGQLNGGVVIPPPIFNLAGPVSAASHTVAIPSGEAFCISAKLTAQSTDWHGSGIKGIAQLGAIDTANSFKMLRVSNSIGTYVTVEMHDAGGVARTVNINPGPTNSLQQVTGCWVPGGGLFAFLDGTLRASSVGSYSFTAPTSLRVASSGVGLFNYGTGVGDVCISGAKGSGTTAPATVHNSCAQFTSVNTGPCWGCVTPLPGAAKVLALGDSITEDGADAYRPYPAKLNALLGTSFNVVNAGVHSNSIAQATARYQSTYKGQGFVRALVLIGVNDILGAGTSAATAWTALQALLDEMRADGLVVTPMTLVPFKDAAGWTAGKQAEADTFNANIRSYCTTHGLTCVDNAVGMADGTDPLRLKSTWDFGDRLHPNQNGCDGLAALVRAALP